MPTPPAPDAAALVETALAAARPLLGTRHPRRRRDWRARGGRHAARRQPSDVPPAPLPSRSRPCSRRALGLPVRLLNDGAAAAWGEYRFGAGRGARSLVFVTISTGVGGGIVLHGRPLSGRQGLAGQVGFLTADPDGPPCGSGRRGTLESVASGAALARQATEVFGRPLDAPALFALHGRDPRADAILDAAAAATARAFADLAALLDPDRIVVGGGVGLAPGYLELVAAHLAAEPELFRPPLARAELGADAGLIGAASWAETDTTA